LAYRDCTFNQHNNASQGMNVKNLIKLDRIMVINVTSTNIEHLQHLRKITYLRIKNNKNKLRKVIIISKIILGVIKNAKKDNLFTYLQMINKEL